MTYREAKKVKVGDSLLMKDKNYISTSVLEIEQDSGSKTIFFRCTNGLFSHVALSLPIPLDNLVKIFIKNPKTRVFIDCNNEVREWLYSVVVDESDGFWLASFDTQQEAEEYIRTHKLIMKQQSGDKL